VQLRPAEPGDASEVAGVHVRSWQVGYRGLLPDEYLDRLQPQERARSYLFGSTDPAQPYTIVAVDEEGICGFATTAPARDVDVPRHGELCALYVDPPCWGRGIGQALISSARERMAQDGFTCSVLWVLVGNARARGFYEADGWAPDGARRYDQVWGAIVDEVRYRRDLA
jgi:ribosomal protein S18 acetylase RimI-like enzyme